MPHSFRLDPPVPRSGSIVRPRLLRPMATRWAHRVTVVIGGAGLGKTTLLAQALHENRLAPRGEDVWLGLHTGDADGEGLARDVLAGVDPGPDGADDGRPVPEPRVVADAVWRRAPQHVCLVLDDVQALPEGSAGAAWLAELVGLLPGNGHVVLAGRERAPEALDRLAGAGPGCRLTEEDLRFTADELAAFAERHEVDPGVLRSTGGWPAMAELAATVEADLAGRYLWEEVLRPLGPARRRVLAAVCTLGGADDALASAMLDEPVDLARDLAGVPLLAVGADGRWAPHGLWRRAPRLDLGDERPEAVRRAVRHLVTGRRYDDAVGLAAAGGTPDVLPEIIRAACVSDTRPTVGELDRWLAQSPPEVLSSPAGALAQGVRAAFGDPAASPGPLRHAAELARAAGDLDAELVAIANLGRVAWWRQDAELIGELVPRVAELAESGHAGWRSLAAIGDAILADLVGDDEGVLTHLASLVPGTLDTGWVAIVTWLAAEVLTGRGEVEVAVARMDAIPPLDDANFGLSILGQRATADWMSGRVDQAVATIEALVGRVEAAGMRQYTGVLLPVVSRFLSHVGEPDRARAALERARRTDAADAAALAVATASLQVAEGDEAAAAATLRRALADHPIHEGLSRRTWRIALCLPYVLVPESRPTWDAVDLRGFHATSRRLAAAVAALREGRRGPAPGLPEVPTGIARAALHHRFAADLAVGLDAAHDAGGAALLEAVGPVGRAAVRDTAATGNPARSRAAKALLAAVPAPPPVVTRLAVLGPLGLARDGQVATDIDLRRERVRALLAFLVTHRRTDRTTIIGALWPDLDPPAAGNNLRVTLSYLLRFLEPWREPGDSPFHVRASGSRVELVTGTWLRIDVDEFDGHIAAASAAEARGAPGAALDHNQAAVRLYRGDLYADVTGAEWSDAGRDHYRSRFAAAAIRAAQLLATLGDVDEADDLAHRAIGVDPWAEDAYAVLVTTALARDDRSRARQALDHCLAALADLGVGPSDETQRLRRRLDAA